MQLANSNLTLHSHALFAWVETGDTLGYNGGDGAAYASSPSTNYKPLGGGATHIALRTGKLREIGVDNIGDILLVAGGGGGTGMGYGRGKGGAGGLVGVAGGSTGGNGVTATGGQGGTAVAGRNTEVHIRFLLMAITQLSS